MKIIHIVRGDFTPNSLNGVYKVIDCLSNALVKQGVEVEVCSVALNSTGNIFKPTSYEHIQVNEHKLRFFLTSDFKDYLLKQDNNTVFHFHSVFIPWFLPAIKFLRKKCVKKIVLTPHGQYVNEAMSISLKKRIFFKLFDSKVLNLVNTVQCIGHTEINDYIKNNAKHYVLIPNGCNNSIYDCDVSDRQLIFGYLGRLECKQKGLDLLIPAFAKYKQNGGKGILKLAGDGVDKDYIQKIAQNVNIKDSVSFVGTLYDDSKWKFLKSCAFFLHPSRWDVIPTAAMEASTCKVPLIVSEETNIDKYIYKYNSGFVIKLSNNPEINICKQLHFAEKKFADKLSYQQMCNNSSQMISKELNWDSIASRDIKELYGC